MSFLVELPMGEFNPNAFKGFNPTVEFDADGGNALAMAWMAQLAYETRLPEKVGAISQLFQLTDVRIVRQAVNNSPLPLSDTRGIIASRGEALIVAFAGTDPLHVLNWVSDFYVGRPTERLHEVTMAQLNRRPTMPESSVTIGVTAKRLHTWEIVVRGDDPEECDRVARLLDDGLSERYAHELEPTGDTLTAKVALA